MAHFIVALLWHLVNCRFLFSVSRLSHTLKRDSENKWQNNSSGAFASDGKINTGWLSFGNPKRLCLLCQGIPYFCV